ncbi:MAG: alpha/beta hydrolase [Chloroflexi bacterium]|nr:alpha/beta hydrolase [Chloroflexota bacterium]
MPTVRVRGIDLYYEEYGSGPDLLFAHGLMGSVAFAPWFGERIGDIAARGLHVVAYDARGHGRSGLTTAPSDYAWGSLAKDMLGVIDALGLRHPVIYGGSMGAGTALMLALDHPDAVSKLILQSPPGFGAAIVPARRQLLALSYLFQFLGPGLTARFVSMLPGMGKANEAAPAFDLRSFLSAQRRRSIVPAIRGLLREGAPLPVERLGEIQQPALVLTHPDDPIHPLSSGDVLHEKLPHAKLAVAPSATYWQEHPEALTHIVAAFAKGEEIARGLPGKVLHQHAPA